MGIGIVPYGTFVEQLAALLDGTVREKRYPQATITVGDAILLLCLNGLSTVDITLAYTDDAGKIVPVTGERITCRRQTDPAAVAKRIQRALLGAYTEKVESHRAWVAQQEVKNYERARVLHVLTDAAAGLEVEIAPYGYDELLDITFKGITMNTATRLIALLHTLSGDDAEEGQAGQARSTAPQAAAT